MTPPTLESLIDQRFQTLTELIDATSRQETAIADGHMNELMSVLSHKQRLIEQLTQLTDALRDARQACPSPPVISDEHRRRHESCDDLHRDLLQRETISEQTLTTRRESLADELMQTNNTSRAASGYMQTSPESTRGSRGRLDLSSD